MSAAETRVAVLTPPGAGAIATVAVSGPRAWEVARQLFRPAGKPLPESPELHRFWFGTLGDGPGDEVILAVTAAGGVAVEVHCHGGRRVVRWVVEQFVARGCVEGEPDSPSRVLPRLQRAPTLRTAAILLDQLHGAFDSAVARVLELLDTDPGAARAALGELVRFAPVGRHLVEPWKVVVAGAPNAGKSSLVNALAGFQRAVVSEVAGTTRDAVRVPLAFDGWPVELTDTAGLREAEGLEAAGVERANQALAEADLILWVLDLTDPKPVLPELRHGHLPYFGGPVLVANKADRPPAWDPAALTFSYYFPVRCGGIATLSQWDRTVTPLPVSAVTGAGLPELARRIAAELVPAPPPPGTAVPFTPRLAALVESAHAALAAGRADEAARLLREALGRSR